MQQKTGLVEDLLKKSNYELRHLRNVSEKWFLQETFKLLAPLRGKTPEQILNNEEMTRRLMFGELYLFVYDPKLKKTLPYYDRLPLVIPFNHAKNGFLGLNLHYLPPVLRAKLFTLLQEHRTNTRLTESTRLAFTWNMLKSASSHPLVKPCVKHYLFDHVRSAGFRKIDAKDWANAVMMPFERFEKAGLQKVWANAVRKMQQ